jgi:hypothetical protein
VAFLAYAFENFSSMFDVVLHVPFLMGLFFCDGVEWVFEWSFRGFWSLQMIG